MKPAKKSPKTVRMAWATWRVFEILGLIMLAGLAFILWPLAKPASARFHADIQTKSVSFSLGDWTDSAGLFASDQNLVDITFQTPCAIKSETHEISSIAQGLHFKKVKLHSLDTSVGLRVFLDVENPGILHYALKSGSAKPPRMSLLLEDRSEVGPVIKFSKTGHEVEWWISSANPDAGAIGNQATEMEFSVSFAGVAPAPEEKISLSKGSGITFDFGGRSAIANGLTSNLSLVEDGRSFDVPDGLRLGGLQRASVETLSVDQNATLLHVIVAGTASEITLKAGEDEMPLVAQGWDRLRPQDKVHWFTDLVEAVTAIATVFVAFYTKKLKNEEDPDRKKRKA